MGGGGQHDTKFGVGAVLGFGVAKYSYEKQNAYGSVSVHEFGTVCLNLNLYLDQYVTLTPNV